MSDNLLTLKDFRIQFAGEASDLKPAAFLATNVVIPDLSIGDVPVPFRNGQAYVPGNRIEYSPLTIDFHVTENMDSYRQIVKWIQSNSEKRSTELRYHDLVVSAVSSHLNPSVAWRFVNAFPTNASGFTLSNQTTETQYATISVTFRYDYYIIEDL